MYLNKRTNKHISYHVRIRSLDCSHTIFLESVKHTLKDKMIRFKTLQSHTKHSRTFWRWWVVSSQGTKSLSHSILSLSISRAFNCFRAECVSSGAYWPPPPAMPSCIFSFCNLSAAALEPFPSCRDEEIVPSGCCGKVRKQSQNYLEPF